VTVTVIVTVAATVTRSRKCEHGCVVECMTECVMDMCERSGAPFSVTRVFLVYELLFLPSPISL
jgi:hypothetical protein